MEKAYATALWKTIQSGMSPADAVRALKEALAKSGREQLLPKIARAFVRVAERAQAHSAVTLTVARAKDASNALSAVQATLAEMKTDSSDVKVVVDDAVIGGWRLEGREQLVDASYKKQLVDLYNLSTQ